MLYSFDFNSQSQNRVTPEPRAPFWAVFPQACKVEPGVSESFSRDSAIHGTVTIFG